VASGLSDAEAVGGVLKAAASAHNWLDELDRLDAAALPVIKVDDPLPLPIQISLPATGQGSAARSS
jgi:hypothetical protein